MVTPSLPTGSALRFWLSFTSDSCTPRLGKALVPSRISSSSPFAMWKAADPLGGSSSSCTSILTAPRNTIGLFDASNTGSIFFLSMGSKESMSKPFCLVLTRTSSGIMLIMNPVSSNAALLPLKSLAGAVARLPINYFILFPIFFTTSPRLWAFLTSEM